MYAALARLLRFVALAASFVVIASFGMFATDQVNGASKQQQAEIANGNWTPPTTVTAHRSGVGRTIDNVDHKLTSPFKGVVAGSTSMWLVESVEAVMALLVFGLGLGYLSRFVRLRA